MQWLESLPGIILATIALSGVLSPVSVSRGRARGDILEVGAAAVAPYSVRIRPQAAGPWPESVAEGMDSSRLRGSGPRFRGPIPSILVVAALLAIATWAGLWRVRANPEPATPPTRPRRTQRSRRRLPANHGPRLRQRRSLRIRWRMTDVPTSA